MKKQHLLLGAHMSIAGGFEKALERGDSIDCTAIQIFTKSNRQWHAKTITTEQASLFIEQQAQSRITTVITHASYLINIGSSDKATREKSIAGLIDELERCKALDIQYLVLHPGSHTGSTLQVCLDTIAESLDKAITEVPNAPMILLELMAGQGSVTCYTFEQLAYILKKSIHSKKLGVCFDTCHAFAAGYHFSTPATYKKMWHDFNVVLGLETLKVIHLNDSKKECGSRVDRHEEIGKGTIGLEAFSLIMNDEQLFDVPKILETPNDALEDYAKNMAILKGLISEKTKQKLNR